MFVSCWFSTIKLQNNGEITNFLGNFLIPNWHYWREHPVLWASRWALVHWQQHPRRGLWRSGIVWGVNCRMKLERRFSKALLCLSIFRKLCSCSAVGDTVFSPPFSSVPERALRFSSLESFIKRASWSLIFFVHLTMYLMTPIAVYGQR